MSPPLPILIAGGGIGGLALALALGRAGIPVHVMERRAQFSEAGAGIQIGPNGQRVLAMLGLADVVGRMAGVPESITVHDGRSGFVLTRLPLGRWIAQRHGAPYWVAHRGDLQAALVAAVEAEPLVTVTLGFDVISCVAEGEAVDVHGANGATLRGAALIGADGVFSSVRRIALGAPAPVFAGRTAARAVIGEDALRAAGVEASLQSAVGVWLAPGAHVVHYPVRGGRDLAIVVIRHEEWQSESWSEPAERQPLLDLIAAQFAPRLVRLLEHAPEWRRWALFELPALPRWSTGRITLLGDAAHPTLPFLAQGGSLALEDAVTLAARILEAEGRIADAFLRYEAERRPRTTAVVAAARRNGQIYHLGGLAAQARNVALRTLPPEHFMRRYDWVYGWQPPAVAFAQAPAVPPISGP